MEKEMLVVAKFKEGDGKFEKFMGFMQSPEGLAEREKASIKTIYVGNEIEKPNKVHIVMETPEADTMLKFMQLPENQEAIKNSGHKQETSVMVVCSN